MEQNKNLLSTDLLVDTIAYEHLRETAKWGKFLGIIGFVISAILVLLALFAGTMMSNLSNLGGGNTLGAGLLTVIYLAIALLYFAMSLFLYRFAVKMQNALQAVNQDSFNDSLNNLKLLYRMMGIIMIIYLSFLALAIVGGLVAALFVR